MLPQNLKGWLPVRQQKLPPAVSALWDLVSHSVQHAQLLTADLSLGYQLLTSIKASCDGPGKGIFMRQGPIDVL